MKITRTVTATVEPILLADVKKFMRVSFTDEDSLITSLIKTARVALENYLGISIVATSIEVETTNYWTPFRIPYTPIVAISELIVDNIDYDTSDYANDGYVRIDGTDLQIKYTAGFTTVPEDLKTALMSMVMYYFDHRGDIGSIPSGILTLVQPYNTNLFL